MPLLEIVLLFAAGTVAGMINSVVGSGSLVTFPTLVALGYPSVLANVTNNIGVLPGSISGAYAYRAQLRGRWRELLPLAAFSAVGGLVGALLLLALPPEGFDTIVPILIIFACVLVVLVPRLKKLLEARADESKPRSPAGLVAGVGLTGIYGGYFGAAQGVILLAHLSIFLTGGIQRANAVKNVLSAVTNGAAAIVFISISQVAWGAAAVLAVGSILGGLLGGRLGQRLSPVVYRVVIVAVGIAAVVYFYLT